VTASAVQALLQYAAAGMFTRRLTVRPGERWLAWSAFAFLLSFIGGLAVLETARDALFLSQLPVRRLPLMYVAIALLSLLLTSARARTFTGASARRAVIVWSLFGAAGTLVLWWFARSMLVAGTPAIGVYAIYIWSGVLASNVVVHFWMLLGETLSITQAKRLFGFIGSGSVLGAITGSGLASVMARVMAPDRLLMASSAGFLFSVLPAIVLGRTTLARADAAPDPQARDARVRDDLRFVAQQPYVRKLATLLLLSTACLTVGDYVFKSEVAVHVPARDLAAFLGAIAFGVNLLSLVCQVTLGPWLLRRFDVSVALSVLPVLLALGACGLGAGLGLMAAVWVKGADGSLRYSLHRTSTELLYVPLADEARRRTKAFLDVIGQRGGQALASLGILALTRAPHGILTGVLGVLAFAWLWAARAIRKPYVDVFRADMQGTHARRGASPDLDADALETIVATLDSADDAEVLAALDTLERERKPHLVPALILHHPSDTIVVRALILFMMTRRTQVASLLPRLFAHASPRVRAFALTARAVLAPDLDALRAHLSAEESPEVRAAGSVHLIAAGEISGAEASARIDEIVRGDSLAAKLALAAAAAFTRLRMFDNALIELLRAPEADARMAAVYAMRSNRAPVFVPALLRELGSQSTRGLALSALRAYGVEGMDSLVAALDDLSQPALIRWQIPLALARLGPSEVADTLMHHVRNEPDGMVRYRCIRALELLVERRPGLVLDRAALQDAIEDTVTRAYRYLAQRIALESGAAHDPLRATAGHALLTRMLRDKEAQAVERLFRLLGLADPGEDFVRIHRGLRSPSARTRASSLEVLESVLQPPLRGALVGLVSDVTPAERLVASGPYLAPQRQSYEDVLFAMLESTSPAVQDVTAYHVAELGLSRLAAPIARLAHGDATRTDIARALLRLRGRTEAEPC
jgi:AAA family ATP:ADP antiporter